MWAGITCMTALMSIVLASDRTSVRFFKSFSACTADCEIVKKKKDYWLWMHWVKSNLLCSLCVIEQCFPVYLFIGTSSTASSSSFPLPRDIKLPRHLRSTVLDPRVSLKRRHIKERCLTAISFPSSCRNGYSFLRLQWLECLWPKLTPAFPHAPLFCPPPCERRAHTITPHTRPALLFLRRFWIHVIFESAVHIYM